MAVLAALFAALTAGVIGFTLTTPRAGAAVRDRLGRLERRPDELDDPLSRPFVNRVGVPIGRRIEHAVRQVLPGTISGNFERWLILAGEPVSVFTFAGIWVLAVIGAVAVAVAGLTLGATGLVLVAVLLSAMLIAVLPPFWLRSRVSERKTKIRRALPDAVDLIVTTVEAGMAIDASLAEVGRETRGPLGEEIRIAVRETALGRGRRDALTAIVERTAVPELRTFLHAVIQAEQTGTPIGPVLRTQANQLRLKRRQHAEAEAQRAPVKMVVVLAGFVLPALLMFIMGPAAMRMMDAI